MGKPIRTLLWLFFTMHPCFAQLPVLIDFEDKLIWELNSTEPLLDAMIPTANFSITSTLSTIPDEDNRWVINDAYAGGVINNIACSEGCPDRFIPAVPQQPPAITNANKQYLHTLSFLATKATPPVLSANYNASLLFRRKAFSKMNKDVSTAGFMDVKVGYWRVGGAGTSIYFSVDQGESWVLLQKLSGSADAWLQATAMHPLLNNKATVRFGILWDDNLAVEDINAITDINGLDEISVSGTPIITTSIGASSVCVGATLPVTVSTPGTFSNENVFTAQLSDASGNFLNPRVIGSISATTSSTITATIPVDMAAGNNYRLRVLSSSPISSSPASAQELTIISLPARPQLTAQGKTELCLGEKVVLTASQASSYLWSTGETTQQIEVSQSGNYTVVVTNAAGCQSQASLPLSVTVQTVVAQPIVRISGKTTLCQGEKVLLTASEAAAYLWSTGATSRSIEVSQSGNYWVKVKNAAGCESIPSTAASIMVYPLPSKPVIALNGPARFCKGGSVLLTAPEAASYKWSTGATTRSIPVTESGAYWITTASALSCESIASDKVTITVVDLPAKPTITADSPTTFCEGGKVVLTAPEANSYLWSTGAFSQSIEVTSSGLYTVSLTNSQACQSPVSAPVEVQVQPLPLKPVISITGNTTFCAGDSVILSAPLSASYQWSDGSTASSMVVRQQGTYRVKVKNGAGCESALSEPVNISVLPLPATPEIEQINLDTLKASIPGTLYEWRKDGVLIAGNTNKVKVSENGTYTVRVKAANSCFSDFSGSFNFMLADKSLWNKVSVFPNPSAGAFTLLIENSASPTLHVQLVTLLGQPLQAYTFANTAKDFRQVIDVWFLSKGVYLLKLTMENQVVYKKILIQQ